MKQLGNSARLFAVVAALVVAAFVVVGCGGDDDGGSGSGSGSASNGDSSQVTPSGESKTFESDQELGDAGKVTVDSKDEFDEQQQEVIATVVAFGDATADRDYKKLCNDLLSKEAQKIGGDCEKTFSQTGEQLKDFKLTVESVTVAEDGKTAKAKVSVTSNVSPEAQSQDLSLIKEGGDWRIQILGQ